MNTLSDVQSPKGIFKSSVRLRLSTTHLLVDTPPLCSEWYCPGSAPPRPRPLALGPPGRGGARWGRAEGGGGAFLPSPRPPPPPSSSPRAVPALGSAHTPIRLRPQVLAALRCRLTLPRPARGNPGPLPCGLTIPRTTLPVCGRSSRGLHPLRGQRGGALPPLPPNTPSLCCPFTSLSKPLPPSPPAHTPPPEASRAPSPSPRSRPRPPARPFVSSLVSRSPAPPSLPPSRPGARSYLPRPAPRPGRARRPPRSHRLSPPAAFRPPSTARPANADLPRACSLLPPPTHPTRPEARSFRPSARLGRGRGQPPLGQAPRTARQGPETPRRRVRRKCFVMGPGGLRRPLAPAGGVPGEKPGNGLETVRPGETRVGDAPRPPGQRASLRPAPRPPPPGRASPHHTAHSDAASGTWHLNLASPPLLSNPSGSNGEAMCTDGFLPPRLLRPAPLDRSQPPPRLHLPRRPALWGGGSGGDRQKSPDGLRAPSEPPSRGPTLLRLREPPSPQRSEESGPEAAFPGHVRATRSTTASAEPPGASDTKKSPGAGPSGPRLEAGQPKGGDLGPAIGRLLVL
nr:basic proline-rich protein-like [Loxodonta africana]